MEGRKKGRGRKGERKPSLPIFVAPMPLFITFIMILRR